MTTTAILLEDGSDISGLSIVAGGLWRVTHRFGFHHAKNKLENERIRAEFNERIRKLCTTKPFYYWHEAWCGGFLIDYLLKVGRSSLKPHPRNEVVGASEVNMITFMWALLLLRMQFRGVGSDKALDLIKAEVIWLLQSFGYRLQGRHWLFCPVSNIWQNQKDWYVIQSNDRGEKISQPPPIHPASRVHLCDVCSRKEAVLN